MVRLAPLLLMSASLLIAVAADARERKAEPNADPNKVVCRTIENTGSRLSRSKQCLTNAQWAENDALNRRDIERIQNGRYKNN